MPLRVFVAFLLFQLLSIAVGQVTFTGNAKFDFDKSRLPEGYAKNALLVIQNGVTLTNDAVMVANGWVTGFDIDNLFLQYDYATDRLFVGVDCLTICGDADGDGNPGRASIGDDPADLGESESVAMMFWPNPPPDFQPTSNFEDYENFYPTFIVGVPSGGAVGKNIFNSFDAYTWLENWVDDICDPISAPYPYPKNDPTYSSCVDAHSSSFPDAKLNFGSRIWQIAGTPNEPYFTKPIRQPTFFGSPSAAAPDIEFTLFNFSQYYNFNFKPGFDAIRFAFALYFGADADRVGEEVIKPTIYSLPCAIQDDCGVCNGNNTLKDVCGVCNGNGNSCKDCLGVPKGNATYDACGVCNGNGTSCVDCAGEPGGRKKYDLCGVCGGDSSSCSCFSIDDLVFDAEDTWIEIGHRQRNHAKDDSLWVAWNRTRALIQFRDVKRQILQIRDGDPEILDAKIRIKIRRAGCEWTDPDIALHKLDRSFVEEEATWECSEIDETGCCQQWRMIGLPPQVQPNYITQASGVKQLRVGQIGYLEFDVKSEIIKLMYEPFDTTVGYLLKKVCEHGPGCVSFFSCEGGECPKLIVQVKTVCPRPPVETEEEPCPDPVISRWNWDA